MSRPGLIAVDIGNSAVKVGWYPAAEEPPRLNAATEASLPQPDWIEQYPTSQPPPDSLLTRLPGEAATWRISSVHREGAQRLQSWVARHRPGDSLQLLTYRDLPIQLDVEFPERVGLDRLAAAVAANALRNPQHAAIVVTSGTAVTVNLIRADGVFAGGAILPGFQMQAAALFGADQLPLLTPASDEAPPPLGRNTDQAIRSGLFWGTVGAVRELVNQLTAEAGSPVDVFVTGGDVRRLATVLGEEVRFVPNMVLAGIRCAG
jgi:type III pantothenate kinase